METTLDLASWQRRLAERGVTPVDVPEGETDEDRAFRLAAQRGARALRWQATRPVMYERADLNDLHPDAQHREPVASWLESGSTTLILAGAIGTGKTHTAYAVANRAHDWGYPVAACTVHDLLAAHRPDGDAAVVRDAEQSMILLLDDLDASKVSAFAQDTMTALLDRRLREGRRQIVTTNATTADLAEAWGGRLVDRLLYGATTLVFRGPSRRVGW